MRPGTPVDFKWVHLDCSIASSFVFQDVQDKGKTQHVPYMDCLHSVVLLLPTDNAQSREGGHSKMPAAVPEGKCTLKS